MRGLARKVLPAPVQRTLRRWLYRSARTTFPKRRIQRVYGDIAPLVELVDVKGERWYDHDRKFEPEIEILRQHRLVPGARVFDLGAHQGVVALALAHLVERSGCVIAVEAIPFDAAAAQRNQELNEFEQLKVINAAIAAISGTVDFVYSGRASWGDPTQPTIEVTSTTIDDLARVYGTPSVVFMDVDGFEVEALRGAGAVLESKPDCYVEVHSELLSRYGQLAEDVLGFFSDHHYDLMISHERSPSRRRFERLARSRHDLTRGFHLIAIAKRPLTSRP